MDTLWAAPHNSSLLVIPSRSFISSFLKAIYILLCLKVTLFVNTSGMCRQQNTKTELIIPIAEVQSKRLKV